MKRQYLLPLLTGLACIGCAKENPEPDADATTILVQSLVGKYRFTKLKSTCFGNTGGNTSSCGGLLEPCDVVISVSRVGKSVTSSSLFGTLPLSYIGTNYVFTNGDPSDLSQASFKKGTDSLIYVRAASSLGGGHSQVYYGQKIP